MEVNKENDVDNKSVSDEGKMPSERERLAITCAFIPLYIFALAGFVFDTVKSGYFGLFPVALKVAVIIGVILSVITVLLGILIKDAIVVQGASIIIVTVLAVEFTFAEQRATTVSEETLAIEAVDEEATMVVGALSEEIYADEVIEKAVAEEQ